MLHLDLFGPVNIMSISKKRYTLVIVDEYTRFTWVYFLHRKDETSTILLDHVRLIETDVFKVKILRSDNGTEFKNSAMEEFCKYKGISQQFSAPGTPQQNGVVERKNRTLIDSRKNHARRCQAAYLFLGRSYQHSLLHSKLYIDKQAWKNFI